MRNTLCDGAISVAISERQRRARCGIPGPGHIIDQDALAKITRQRDADGPAAFNCACWRGGDSVNHSRGQRRVVDSLFCRDWGRRLSGHTRHGCGSRLVDAGESHLIRETDRLCCLPHKAIVCGHHLALCGCDGRISKRASRSVQPLVAVVIVGQVHVRAGVAKITVH